MQILTCNYISEGDKWDGDKYQRKLSPCPLSPIPPGDAEANAAFFAQARSDILSLLEEIDRLTQKEDA
jgi:hypothetical protein